MDEQSMQSYEPTERIGIVSRGARKRQTGTAGFQLRGGHPEQCRVEIHFEKVAPAWARRLKRVHITRLDEIQGSRRIRVRCSEIAELSRSSRDCAQTVLLVPVTRDDAGSSTALQFDSRKTLGSND